MKLTKAQCLVLACGNTLRSDDGIGPYLCAWAEERFASEPGIRAIARQQWTPELSEEIAFAQTALFIDCSVESAPGSVKIDPVEAASPGPGLATHHIGAAELLALAQELFGSLPRYALLMTIGAGSIELGERFSPAVQAALPRAQELLEKTLRELLETSSASR